MATATPPPASLRPSSLFPCLLPMGHPHIGCSADDGPSARPPRNRSAFVGPRKAEWWRAAPFVPRFSNCQPSGLQPGISYQLDPWCRRIPPPLVRAEWVPPGGPLFLAQSAPKSGSPGPPSPCGGGNYSLDKWKDLPSSPCLSATPGFDVPSVRCRRLCVLQRGSFQGGWRHLQQHSPSLRFRRQPPERGGGGIAPSRDLRLQSVTEPLAHQPKRGVGAWVIKETRPWETITQNSALLFLRPGRAPTQASVDPSGHCEHFFACKRFKLEFWISLFTTQNLKIKPDLSSISTAKKKTLLELSLH